MYSMCEENLLFCKAQDQYLLLHVHPKALITNRKKYGVNNQMECMDQVKNSHIRETTWPFNMRLKKHCNQHD